MNRVAKYEVEVLQEMAVRNNEIITMLGLDHQYIKSVDLCGLFGCCDRELRKMIEDIQFLYIAGYMDGLVIGTNKGYHFTTDKDEIYNYAIRKRNHFKSEAYASYKLAKKVTNNDNLTLQEFLD